ncbi:MAG: hypothetical protein RR924_05060 [Bacteroides sp.]
MSDTKWLLKHGFHCIESLSNGFSLLVLKLNNDAPNPAFKEWRMRTKERIGHLLHESLSFYRLLCKWFSMGVGTREQHSTQNNKIGNDGTGTNRTYPSHYILGFLQWQISDNKYQYMRSIYVC